MIAVQGVAAAAEIVIIPIGRQHVVDVVVKALEGEEGAHLIALGGVVKDHIQDDLDPIVVEGFDQLLELITLHVPLGRGGIAGVGGKEAYGIVAPVI